MKMSNKILNEYSDEENDLGEEDEEEDESVEEQSQDDGDDNDEEDEEEDDDENEGDEVDDDEDFVEENENVAPNVMDKRQSLGGGNKKVFLQKPSTKKKPSIEKKVYEAITQLNERAGSSSEAIKKYIMSKDPEENEELLKKQIKRHIKSCLTDGTMIQIKRSFKITNKHKLKIKELNQKKEKAKKEKLKEKKEKLPKEKKKEKKTEEKKTTGKSNNKSKEKTKAVKSKAAAKPEAIDEAKNKPGIKIPKLDKVGKKADSKPAAGKTKTEKLKTKNKLARKSINLVIRPTPPRPKSMKNTKSAAVAEKKKVVNPAAESGAANNAAPAAVKTTGKGRKK